MAEQHELLKEEWKQETQDISDQTSTGEFASFAVLVEREGGGVAGLMAAKNYLASAMENHKKGISVGNRPWFIKHKMTKMLTIHHVKMTWEDTHREKDSHLKKYGPKPALKALPASEDPAPSAKDRVGLG